MKKWGVRIFVLSFILIIAGLGLTLHVLLPKLIVNTQQTKATAQKIRLPASFGANDVYITTLDSLKLAANLSLATGNVRGTIILLHGIRGYKEHFIPLAQYLNENGYNTLALDLRAHGNSEGSYCTYGFYEKKDIASCVDFLLARPKADSNIGVWGQSLGGAIALQAMAYDSRIKFGIIESTFSNLNTIVSDYSERMFGFNIPWVSKYALSRAGVMADFKPNEVSPGTSAKRITQPVLVAHGTADKHISYDYGKQNFDHLSSVQKVFLPVDGAAHQNLWQVGGTFYFDAIDQFLSSLP
ncbi:lysophospholipase [Bacteroidia bacterium]|nr:lysophospholipase [Bacteroidia bacterium]